MWSRITQDPGKCFKGNIDIRKGGNGNRDNKDSKTILITKGLWHGFTCDEHGTVAKYQKKSGSWRW